MPPPLGGVQGTSELRLPARADKGPSRGSHKRFITGGGGQPAGLRRGYEHGAAVGSTPGSGKTKWGCGDILGLLSRSLQPPPKPPVWPLPFPPQSLPSRLPLRTFSLVLCSFGIPKSLTLLLPDSSLFPTSFPNLMPTVTPHRKGCPHDPLRLYISVWKAPSRGAWKRKRKT